MSKFDDLFDTFQCSAWRLEVRDTYNVPGEAAAIAEYARTGCYSDTDDDHAWYAMIRSAAARGATVGRVRLIGHPITDYTRWELAAYAGNVNAGEDIRILDRRWLDPSWDHAPDVWLFDDRHAIKMLYSDNGEWAGYEEVAAAPYANLRRTITPYAVPYHQYRLDDIPTPRREAAQVTLPAALAA